MLHFDDLRPEIAQDHGAEGTGQDPGQIEDTDAAERKVRERHYSRVGSFFEGKRDESGYHL
jgi:hypothetical protein